MWVTMREIPFLTALGRVFARLRVLRETAETANARGDVVPAELDYRCAVNVRAQNCRVGENACMAPREKAVPPKNPGASTNAFLGMDVEALKESLIHNLEFALARSEFEAI